MAHACICIRVDNFSMLVTFVDDIVLTRRHRGHCRNRTHADGRVVINGGIAAS